MRAAAPTRPLPLRGLRIVRCVTRLNIGGPARHVAILAQGLAEAGAHTHVVLGEPEPGEGSLQRLIAPGPGVTCTVLPTLRRPLHAWRDARAVWALARVLWRERPHVVHTHMAKAGLLGRLAALAYNRWGPGRRPGARARILHTFHGHVLEGYFPRWLTAIFVTMERFLARRSDVLIAVSPAVRDELLALGIGTPRQWAVVPLGLDLAPFSALPPEAPDAPVLRAGLVGRLVPIKNPGLFLASLAGARRAPGVRVEGWVVGDGPLRPGLEGQAEALGLAESIQFGGWQHDMRAVYERLTLACLTSWNEGTPVALIEAMAAGRPVIATDVGGVRDLLLGEQAAVLSPPAAGAYQDAGCGLLVRAGDVEGFTRALVDLAADAPRRARMGAAARARVLERYARQRLVADIVQLYADERGSEATCAS